MTLQVKPIVEEFSEPLWKSTCTPSLIEVVGVAELLVFVARMMAPTITL